MNATNTPLRLAKQLTAVAHTIRDTHGDLAAQTVPYGLLLRRWNPSLDVSPLLDEAVCSQFLEAIQSALDETAVETVRRYYQVQGKDAEIYFYEEFLRAYDGANARARGVHYSPPEVISSIVRGVDSILRRSFDCNLNDALVVDPCCGVGTFLRHIERRSEHGPRMLGLELMPAPFIIASCLLKQAQVLNTDWLTYQPAKVGNRVPVILGNPPYSGHSSNPGKIADMMADYRKGLNERNPKWLQDDYVKFIRMAQHHIDAAGRGIVAFITNHSYLTNPTFRAMRESLAQTFDEIYVIDLHGNVKRQDGRHQNIFPIQMGVAISFFVKKDRGKECSIRYFSIDGDRDTKLSALASLDFDGVPWSPAPLETTFSLFTPSDHSLRREYESHPSILDIFRESSIGFVTSRDKFAIGFTRDEVRERIAALRDGDVSDEELRSTYPIGDLDIQAARAELRNDPDWQSKIIGVLYRPFDYRWAYYSRATMERPRLPFMKNLMRDNAALAVGRAGNVTGSEEWDVVFCTDRPTDLNLFRRGGAKLFPRWVYQGEERISNMQIGPEDGDAVFAYIYAVLHSQAYRSRYADFLRIDYPRIPMPSDHTLLQELARLGRELIDAHLMRYLPSISSEHGATLRVGGYLLPDKTIADRVKIDGPGVSSAVRVAVAATIALQRQIDSVVSEGQLWAK